MCINYDAPGIFLQYANLAMCPEAPVPLRTRAFCAVYEVACGIGTDEQMYWTKCNCVQLVRKEINNLVLNPSEIL